MRELPPARPFPTSMFMSYRVALATWLIHEVVFVMSFRKEETTFVAEDVTSNNGIRFPMVGLGSQGERMPYFLI